MTPCICYYWHNVLFWESVIVCIVNVLSLKTMLTTALHRPFLIMCFSFCQLTAYSDNNYCHSVNCQQQTCTYPVCRMSVDVLLFRFLAFGHGGNLLSLYRVAARVGVYELTSDDLTDENKLTLCNKVLDDINEGLTLYAQVFVSLLIK